jgi:protein-disulfide isomerase
VSSRLSQLGVVLVLAAATVVVIPGAASAAGSSATRLFAGIPQKRFTLGKASAPVTLVEFNDLQCPFCRRYTSAVLPALIRRYVRTGKVRMRMRPQAFIGSDSVKAGKALAAAALQNRAWQFSDVFYAHQGKENTGYVTKGFLRSIARKTSGLSPSRLFADMNKPAAIAPLKAAAREFDARGLDGIPAFLIGKTGGRMKVLQWTDFKPAQFTGPIDRLLGT